MQIESIYISENFVFYIAGFIALAFALRLACTTNNKKK